MQYIVLHFFNYFLIQDTEKIINRSIISNYWNNLGEKFFIISKFRRVLNNSG